VQRLLTDNGAAFHSREFKAICTELGIKHGFMRPNRPQTDGKTERFIPSASREWAYGWSYQNSAPSDRCPGKLAASLQLASPLTAASAASRPCPDSIRQETIS
jgi:transposase InsO family protein